MYDHPEIVGMFANPIGLDRDRVTRGGGQAAKILAEANLDRFRRRKTFAGQEFVDFRIPLGGDLAGLFAPLL